MNKQNIIWTIIVSAIVAAIVVVLWPHSTSQTAGASPNGTINTFTPTESIVFQPSTGSGTSTSLLNTDGNDRIIKTIDNTCVGATTTYTAYTGAGLATWYIEAATTSTPNPLQITNTNLVLLTTNTIATSSQTDPLQQLTYISSSSPGLTGAVTNDRIWAANSYLSFWSNATNTSSCTLSVTYIRE